MPCINNPPQGSEAIEAIHTDGDNPLLPESRVVAKECSLIGDCGNQLWAVASITGLSIKLRCLNCGGTKTVFRNLYPGYY